MNSTGAEIVMPQDIATPGQYYTGIQMSTIMSIVNTSKVRNKIIILDCCHSGNIGKYELQDVGSILNTGVSVLTACREDEVAMEAGGHGLFTELLCTALNGGASDYCGNITIGGVYAYIDRSLDLGIKDLYSRLMLRNLLHYVQLRHRYHCQLFAN